MHSTCAALEIACTVLDVIDRQAYITLQELVTSINADKPSDHECSADASPTSLAFSYYIGLLSG